MNWQSPVTEFSDILISVSFGTSEQTTQRNIKSVRCKHENATKS